MAEVIGILSSAITFVDAAGKVLKFCSDLHHAPQKVETHQQHLRDMLRLVQSIRHDLDRISNGTGVIPVGLIAQSDLDEVNSVIKQALGQIQGIEGILDGVGSPADAGKLKRSWRSLRAQNEILEKFQGILGLKDSLQVWLNRQTLLLSGRQVSAIEALGGRIDAAHHGVAQTVSSAGDSLLLAIRSSGNDSQRRLDTLMSQNEALEIQNEMIIRLVSGTTGQSGPQQTYTTSSSRASQASDAFSFISRNMLYRSPACTCKSRPPPIHQSWGPVSLISKTKSLHGKECPLYGKSVRHTSISIRLPLLQFVLNASLGSQGFSLTQNIKRAARIVDPNESEAFQMIRRAQLWRKEGCEELIRQLAGLFREGKASVHDQDEHGMTLFLTFIRKLSRREIIYSPELFETIASAVSIFVDQYGADVHHFSTQMGNPLDIAIAPVEMMFWRNSQHEIPIESLLLKYSCEPQLTVTRSDLKSLGHKFHKANCCFRHPELADDLGFPEYYRPIFQKSVRGIHALIQQGHNWNKWDHRFLAPVECTVIWLEGLEILLNSGADIQRATIMATYFNITDTLEFLISQDCPAFFRVGHEHPAGPKSILHVGTANITVEACRSIVRHVARTRQMLAQIGIANLPAWTWQHKHLLEIAQRGLLLDEFALDIWKALQARKVEVPGFIWPGTAKSVYIDEEDFFKNTRIEPLVELLFDEGFKNIDIADDHGWTPLLLACERGALDLATYFWDHGADLRPEAVWVWARSHQSCGSGGSARFWNHLLVPQRDECDCYCSTCGCLPATLVIRLNQSEGPLGRRSLIFRDLYRIPPETTETYIFEACRLEVFTRLGMAHTCCRGHTDRFGSLKKAVAREQIESDERDEIQHEDRELALILEEYMDLSKKLYAGFEGHWDDFLRAWWAALDVMLPGEGHLNQVAKQESEILVDRPEDKTGTTQDWLDARGFQTIFHHLHSFLPFVSSFVNVEITTVMSKEVHTYLVKIGIPLLMVEWLSESEVFERPDVISWLYGYLCHQVGEGVRSAYIRDKIIPHMTATVIRDVEAGRIIPTDLYDYLVSEGVIVDGQLSQGGSPIVSRANTTSES